MRIGIVGNYGNNNNGDEAILLGILHQLTHHFDVKREDIVVFSNNPKQTELRFGTKAAQLYYKRSSMTTTIFATMKRSYKIMKDLDVVIIGGGGILMDLYRREAPLFSTYGLLANYAGCKVIVYGVGAGPINLAVGKFFIKRLAKIAESISVRDPESRGLLHAIGVKKDITVVGDPAFSIVTNQKKKKTTAIKNIGVTAVPYFNSAYWPKSDHAKYKAYIDSMAANLDRLIEEKDVHVTFFSTKFPQDVEASKDIANRMKQKEKVTVIEEHLDPEKLLKICADQDVIIGTRLHSLILALVVTTPVIGIEYHHKVEHFMDMIEQSDYSLSMEDIQDSSETFVTRIQKMEENWIAFQDRIAMISKFMKEKASKGMEQFKEVMLQKETKK